MSFCLFVFLSRHLSDQMSEVSQASKVTICVRNSKVAAVPEGYKPVPEGYKPVPEGYKHTRSPIELPGQLKTFIELFSSVTGL